jgi:hypothetical protein
MAMVPKTLLLRYVLTGVLSIWFVHSFIFACINLSENPIGISYDTDNSRTDMPDVTICSYDNKNDSKLGANMKERNFQEVTGAMGNFNDFKLSCLKLELKYAYDK